MKKTLAIISLLMLTACDPTPEEEARLRQTLPIGCSVKNLGSYGDVRNLVMVDCMDRSTRTLNYRVGSGKTSVRHATFVVE